MNLFRREFRNPFELVVARRIDNPIQSRSVEPDQVTIHVGGVDYVVDKDPRVKVPELSLEPEPVADVHTWSQPVARPKAPDSPEVALRKAVRLCLEKEVPTDRISDIVKLELVDFVMES